VSRFCDSDCAGDVETRRSTSGEAIFLGETLVESSSPSLKLQWQAQQDKVIDPLWADSSLGCALVCAFVPLLFWDCFLVFSQPHDQKLVKNLVESDFGLRVETPRNVGVTRLQHSKGGRRLEKME
jgi:hypothetical protein